MTNHGFKLNGRELFMFVAPVHVFILMFIGLAFELVESTTCGIVTNVSKVSIIKILLF